MIIAVIIDHIWILDGKQMGKWWLFIRGEMYEDMAGWYTTCSRRICMVQSVNIAKRTIESAEEPFINWLWSWLEICLWWRDGLNYWIGWWRMNVFIQLGFIRWIPLTEKICCGWFRDIGRSRGKRYSTKKEAFFSRTYITTSLHRL